MGASKQPAARKAMSEAIQNARELRRMHDKIWNGASHAPMFYKEYEKVSKDSKGKIVKKSMVRRSARLINGHAFQIAAAGAASAAIREMRTDCANLGIDYTSTTSSPFLPALAKCTKLVLEQFLAAYIQEVVLSATQGMTSIAKYKRLNGKVVKEAFHDVNQQIFNSAGPAPRTTVVVPLSKPTKKKKTTTTEATDNVDEEGGGDFEAGAEPDEAAEEAEMAEEEEEE